MSQFANTLAFEELCRELLELDLRSTLDFLQETVRNLEAHIIETEPPQRMTWKRREEVTRKAKANLAEAIKLYRAERRALRPEEAFDRVNPPAWAVAWVLEGCPQ